MVVTLMLDTDKIEVTHRGHKEAYPFRLMIGELIIPMTEKQIEYLATTMAAVLQDYDVVVNAKHEKHRRRP